MKYFLLFLVSFSLFAQEFKSELSEIPKEQQALAQTKKISGKYKQLSVFCSNQGYEVALVTICEQKLKVKLEDAFAERLNLVADDLILAANKQLTDALSEQKCVSELRKRLENLNIGYQNGDDCSKLKTLLPK